MKHMIHSPSESQLGRPKTITEAHKEALIGCETLANQEEEERVSLGAVREAL